MEIAGILSVISSIWMAPIELAERWKIIGRGGGNSTFKKTFGENMTRELYSHGFGKYAGWKKAVFGVLAIVAGVSPLLNGQGRSSPDTLLHSPAEARILGTNTVKPLPGWTSRQEGEKQVLSPSNIPSGGFVMTVEPAEAFKGSDFEQWFQNRVGADVARRGGARSRAQIMRNGDRMLYLAVSYRESTVLYCAVRREEGTVQFSEVQTSLTAARAQHYMTESGLMLAQLVTGNGPRAEKKASTIASSAPDERGEQERAESPAAAGPGVPPEAVEAILHEGAGTTTVWGYAYVETIHLLLKDGWEYAGLDKAPSDLNVNASRQESPKWHHWRKAGNAYLIQENGTWRTLTADVVRPLEPGSGLNAKVQYSRAYTAGGMGGSVFTRSFSFSPNGRFERSNSALHGTGAVQAAQGVSGGAAISANRQGRSAAGGFSSGTAVTEPFSSKSNLGAGDMAGTYRILGYTLELHCDSGKVEHLLAFYPDPREKSSIYLGDATFSPPKN